MLEKLADIAHNKDAHEARNYYLLALRAVVELHKPHDKYKGVCSGCYEEESGFSDYPCPTIQAIEKELK